MVKFKQKTTITKRNTWWNLIIAMWQQKEEKVALPEFMRQAHYFKNKHKKNTIVKSYANKSKKTNICLRKSILYFMEKIWKIQKKRYVKARRQQAKANKNIKKQKDNSLQWRKEKNINYSLTFKTNKKIILLQLNNKENKRQSKHYW